MLRHERRLLIDCLGVGVALTMLVIAADASGLLTPLENWLYDRRALLCQFFTPPPTDKLVHLDIDDPALDVIGRWPWPRAKVAQILDELRLAEPKAVEMDLLFTEPQEMQFVPVSPANPTTLPASQPALADNVTTPVDCVPLDNDAELARALAALNNVIIPATLKPISRQPDWYRAMVEALERDLEQDDGALEKRIRSRGFAGVPSALEDHFFVARREAMLRRLEDAHVGPNLAFSEVRAKLLPNTPAEVSSGVVRVLKEEWEKYLAVETFGRFSLPAPTAISHFSPMRINSAPLRVLSNAAAGGAFVDYTQFGSPVLRSLPLMLEQKGRFYPQMGLALACRMLDADPQCMRVEADRLIVPRTGGEDLKIPLAPPRLSTDGYLFGNLIDIPWFGGRQWETMYDWPAHKARSRHLSLNEIWHACATRQRIQTNNGALDDAIRGLFQAVGDQSRCDQYNTSIPPVDDFATREKLARGLIGEFEPYMDIYRMMNPDEMEPKDKKFLINYKAIGQLIGATPSLVKQLNDLRQSLAQNVKGKAVLIGWTATAAIADFVSTSLHDKCPGPVVHGVIFNGIMTGELWTRWPWWAAAGAAGIMGMLTAIAVGFLAPMRALLVAVALAAAYALINGVILFDYGNRVMDVAGPLTTIGVVWGGSTLTRVVVEATERARITRRFSTYASPRLVDYVLEHPEVRLDGENREMSIVYTDLAGFTTLSEKLGEKIVPVLNELLGELVPIVEDQHYGLINKFLGDGIMFFFNAPVRQEDHASRAVSSVLAMHEKVQEFNPRLRARGLPELSMRAGIACGVVIVGDAGMEGRSDYTVLGDSANLGSRLEAANKQVGTRTLMNDRVRELLKDGEFLVRPIGRIKVVGKDEAVMCFEPLARMGEATEQQRELAMLTAPMVEAFMARRFDEAARCADEIDAKFGASKLTDVYRSMCRHLMESPPGDDFDGRIVLTEK